MSSIENVLPSNAISAGNRDKEETLLRRNAVLDSWPLHYSRSPGNGIVSTFLYLFSLLFFSLSSSSFFLVFFVGIAGDSFEAANSLGTGNCFYHRSLHFRDCFGEMSLPLEKYHFCWLQSDNYNVNNDIWTYVRFVKRRCRKDFLHSTLTFPENQVYMVNQISQ